LAKDSAHIHQKYKQIMQIYWSCSQPESWRHFPKNLDLTWP